MFTVHKLPLFTLRTQTLKLRYKAADYQRYETKEKWDYAHHEIKQKPTVCMRKQY